jgi:hypothetical protein
MGKHAIGWWAFGDDETEAGLNMSNMFCQACSECFDGAMNAERVVCAYYMRLADLFSRETKVADVFRLMAQDESDFAKTLKEIKDCESHSVSIHDSVKEITKALASVSDRMKDPLKSTPKNLDEAWLFACDLERSAINDIYLKLTADLSGGNGPEGNFIGRHVNNHIQRLRDMGEKYDAARRRLIIPKTI